MVVRTEKSAKPTADQIMDVAESLLARASSLDEVSIRTIAREAGVSLSAVSYHFGSRDRLVLAVAKRVYQRLCTERLNRLKQAIDASAPGPAELEAVIAALVEPSIRWQSSPGSGYLVFRHFSVLRVSHHDSALDSMAGFSAEHLGLFVQELGRIAPWLSEGEIGWRIHCALGIRQTAFRDQDRCRILTRGAFDPADPQALLDKVVEVVAPMFRRSVGDGGPLGERGSARAGRLTDGRHRF
ncbi:transcriptional regulator, TetR family [Tistlia consotensis]|uniref:Transcriptional regulator, TetR family n=1 Tax=Tistlia consotensis USBA 355 TaxID=560819 RepID=A0A1Y6BRB2_9PROT|nr:TetR/AcrR family transcriptional regulator [Tistlia consotensis]SMF25025.1 transcriptional regulator, TetR family [Tistlia consotensis USBA 355]SNR60166.1 transcriptional regulator, TetR family [Tistlia consotensis]